MAKIHRGRTWKKAHCGYTPSYTVDPFNIVTDEDVEFAEVENLPKPRGNATVTCKHCQRKMEVS